MQTTVQTLRTFLLACRPARATMTMGLLLILGLAPSGLAQTIPLSFSKNYILSGGDYVVGGVGLRGAGDATGFATGKINIPDSVQAAALGVQSLPRVPDGASIVAAFLYWETVEKSKSQFSGQNGFFGPFNSDGTVSSHPITGTVLGNPNAPSSWSSGGCAGSSGGTTTLRTYRADVRPFLPLDANGNIAANGSYQVSLADSGSNGGGAPLTLGATLVLIYRVIGGGPMNAIILYDGAFAPSNQISTMTQPMQGFYQPAPPSALALFPAAKITHIVGDGQTNKSEQVIFNNNLLTSLYTNTGNPPFPGVYNSNGQVFNGSWDNPTWDVSGYVKTVVPPFPSVNNVTTSVVPGSTTTSGSGGGCVDWGTIIFSTTVQSTDQDSLLDVWKTRGGYCDAAVNPGTANEGVCAVGDNSWVPLPGATIHGPINKGRDLFVQVDHFDSADFVSSGGTSGHSHKLKQLALDMVGDALSKHHINLHVDCNDCYLNLPGTNTPDPYVIHSGRLLPSGDVINEDDPNNSASPTCHDNPNATPPIVCEFPGVAVTRWKGDFTLLKNQPLNYPDELSCETQTPPGATPGTGPACVRRFQHGRKDSYHEVILGHAFGLASNILAIADGTLDPMKGIFVDATTNTATVTTSSAHGLSSATPVTVSGAILALSPPTPSLSAPFGQVFNLNGNYSSITVTSPTTFTFPVTICPGTPECVPAGTYNNPELFIASGPALSISGWSDLPGRDTLISLGLWGSDNPADDQVGSVNTQAGTFGHELGHTLGLQHGGGDSVNCKPNYQSVMSYQNQVRLLHGFDGNTYFDYSGQALPLLDETMLNESLGLGTSNNLPNGAPLATTYRTRWYAPLSNNFLYSQLNTIVGAPVAAGIHCDGTPIDDKAQMVRLEGPLVPGAIDWNNNGTTNTAADVGFAQDINFNDNFFNPSVAGNFDLPFAGYNDWANLDLRQIGGAPGVFGYSGDDWGAFGLGGSTKPIGTGGVTGAMVAEGDGGTTRPIGTGGTIKPFGTGGQEADLDQANSTVDPPISVGLKQVSKTVVVTWAPPGFGRIRTYYIWRANTTNGPISATNLPVNIGKVTGTPPCCTPPLTTFTDSSKLLNKNTYTYFVTAALGADSGKNNGNQSGPSNMPLITVVF